MTRRRIAIVTRTDDFHAEVVRHTLARRGHECRVILSDSLCGGGGITWATPAGGRAGPGTIAADDGTPVAVADLDLLWWRRLTGEPRLPAPLTDAAARDVVVNDSRAALEGLLLTDFAGIWLSRPEATRAAQNKLVQLRAAERAGLRVPRTLVSQDPGAVRRFCADLGWRVVVKTVAGTRLTPLMTGAVTPDLVASDDAVRLSPAIYQEEVSGSRHLRACCFGSEVVCALLESDRLDWRYPLDARAEPYALDGETSRAVARVVADLGLRMGIADLKLGPDGEPVWLEVNPQGQFLFLEGLCGMPLTATFVDFLEREAGGTCPPAAATRPGAARG